MLGIATGAKLHAGDKLAPTVARLKALNCDAIRFSSNWAQVEPVLGDAFDFSSVDPIVDACAKAGIQIVLEASTRGTNDIYSSGAHKFFPRYMATQAQRYAERNPGTVIATASINEPNHVKTDRDPSAKNYTNLILKPSYEACKKLAPSVTVLTGGLGGASNDSGDDMGDAADFFESMYVAGAQGYFDALAFHPYDHPYRWTDSIAKGTDGPGRMLRCRESMRKHGDKAKRIWVTEYGSNTGGNRTKVTYLEQAAQLLNAVTWCRAHAWVGPFFWFTLDDDPKEDMNNYGDTMGLVDIKGVVKPAGHVFAALAA